MQHFEDVFEPEDGAECFVLAEEAESDEAVPLDEIDRWRRVLWLDSHDTTLNLRGWLETVLGYLDEVVDSREKLDIHAEPAVHIGTGLSEQPLRELSLKHEYCASELGSMLQQLKDQRTTNLVGRIGNADIEERHWCLNSISLYNTEFIGVSQFIHSLRDFSNHPRINLHRNNLLASLKELDGQVTRSWTNL